MRTGREIVAGIVLAALLAGCHTLPSPPAANPPPFSQVGLASWYGPHFNRKLTAEGERFDMNALTAAHRTLPLDSLVRVTNIENGRSVVVRINDRGPYARGRIIDLSARAARDLGMKEDGLVRVRLELVNKGQAAL